MKHKLLPGYSLRRLVFLLLPVLLFLPFISKGQDTLYYQGWEGDAGKNGLHGFEQYNNQTWSQQNVWARSGVTGINSAGSKTFYVLNPLPPSKQCNDSPFDSCIVSESANFRGQNGAHIITGAVTPNLKYAEFNNRHSGYHTAPYCPFPAGCEGNTVETSVGLYSPKIKMNKSYTQVKVEFWCKVVGELNRDFGMLRYSVNPKAPHTPIPDGAKNISVPDNYWKTVNYADDAMATFEYPLYAYNGDTIYGMKIKPEGSTVPGQLQGFRVPKGIPAEGKPIWVKLSMTLPAEAAGDTNLRICFWWKNDNNGTTEATGFPALTIDEVTVIGYKFAVAELNDNFYCPKEKISVPFSIDRAFYEKNMAGREERFVAHLTDSTGNFLKVKNIGSIAVSDLKMEGNMVSGTIIGEIPENVPQLPIGGYRVKVEASRTGYVSAICPTVITIFPVPTYTLSPADTTVCPGQLVTLTVTGKADRYQWYRNDKMVGETQNPVWETRDSGSYRVRALINGCFSFTNLAVIRHKPLRNVSFTLPDNQDTVCYLAKLSQIGGASPTGGTFFWYYEGRDGNGRTEVRGQSFDSYLAGTGKHAIGYEFKDSETGCTEIAFDTIFVADIPYTRINNADTALLCQDKPTVLTLDRPSKSVVWSTGETTNSITVNKAGTYTAKLTNEFGCTYDAKIVVLLIPPVPQAPTIEPQPRIGEAQVRGKAVASPYKPRTQVRVFINDKLVTTTTVNKDGTYTAFLPNPLNAGDKISVQVGYDTDCDGVITVNDKPSPFTVFVVEDEVIDIPNAFSPNGDGKNDTWVVVNRIRERFPNAVVYVYNRWGNEVYRKEGYDNTFDGKDLSDETYYYVVDFKKSGVEIRKGSLTIMR